MSIEGYVREPTEGDTWATRQSTPKGYRRVIVDEFVRADSSVSNWRRLSQPRRCRFMEARKGCGRPAVVEVMRGYFDKRRPWGYCERHLFGRHWQDGRLLYSILVAEDEQP